MKVGDKYIATRDTSCCDFYFEKHDVAKVTAIGKYYALVYGSGYLKGKVVERFEDKISKKELEKDFVKLENGLTRSKFIKRTRNE